MTLSGMGVGKAHLLSGGGSDPMRRSQGRVEAAPRWMMGPRVKV